MSEIRYLCEGNCNTKVTIDEFKQGKNTCTSKDCDNHGQPLIRGEYCPSCNTTFDEGEDHICF